MISLFYSSLLLLTTLALTGCTPQGTLPAANRPGSEVPAVISAATPTFTQPLPPSATATLIPMPTATATPLPTLNPTQAEATIRALLQEPMDCLAPCFWGITPGETTLEEATNIFAHLGLHLQFTNARDKKEFYEIIYASESGLTVSPLLTIQDERVKNFRIYITPEKSQPGLLRAWLAYSPETLIARYGPPSQVWFYFSRTPDADLGPSPWYVMIASFEAVDLVIQYGGGQISAADKYLACPLADQFDSVRIWLGKNPEQPPGKAVPLEEATPLTLTAFAALMTGEPEDACFELRAELFP